MTYARVAQRSERLHYKQEVASRCNRRAPGLVRGSNPASGTVSWARGKGRTALRGNAADVRPAPSYEPDTALGWRHQTIGPDDCPYLERWVFNFGPVAVRLHHFFRSDEDHLHDHPWWFAGVILRGSYYNVTERGSQTMRPGKFYFRRALHRHRVVTDGCWTLIVTGRKRRDWGFWVDGIWKRQRKYFREHATLPCDD